MEILRSVNGQPMEATELAALAVSNDILRDIFDQALAREQRELENSGHCGDIRDIL